LINIRQTLELLVGHEVEFVVIGGVAIRAHGSAYVTVDLDICYARNRENLTRISRALADLNPRFRDFPADLPFVWDDRTLQHGTNFTLVTALGEVDLLGEVAGLGDYRAVQAHSTVIPIFDLPCQVLGLEGLIIAKRAAGRPKDLLVLPELEALLELSE
jgi:hypothetical protein